MMNTTAFKIEDVDVAYTDSFENYFQSIYIACEITGCLILIATLYLALCLIIHGRKTGRFRSSYNGTNVNRGTVYTAAVITIALSIPRYITNQFVFNAHNIPNGLFNCETLLDVCNVCYFTSMAGVYNFLWIRQRALYAHPAMKRLAGKYVNYISWVTRVAIIVAAIAVLLWFVIPDDYTQSKYGCIVRPSPQNTTADDMSQGVYYIVLLGLLVFAQIALLGLFVYPLIRSSAIQSQSLRRSSKHQNVKMSVKKDSETATTTIKSSRIISYIRQMSYNATCGDRKRRTTIERTIRRSVICAAISMASDLATMVVAILAVPSDIPRSLHNVVYDIGLFISVLCIFGTFEGCIKVFYALCQEPAPKNNDLYGSTDNDTPAQQTFKAEKSTADRHFWST